MSYMMCARITFPGTDKRKELVTHLVSSVQIESSWKMLTDTAEIILPRNMRYYDGKELTEILCAGDGVKVELGYDKNFVTEFEGYIVSVSRGIPITIRCEDEMYKLKRTTVSYSKKSVTVQQLLSDVAKGYEVQTSFGDTALGAVRYSGVRVSEILNDLQKKAGLYTYFIGKKLYCGDVYSDKSQLPEVRIELEKNAVSQDLNETSGEYEVIAIAMQFGKKLEGKAGVKGAETFKITYSDKDEKITVKVLEEFAKRFYDRLKKQKYKGGVEMFGIPSVTHGMVINLSSIITPEMDGKYYIEKVTKEFSDNATYRQKIDLGGHAE